MIGAYPFILFQNKHRVGVIAKRRIVVVSVSNCRAFSKSLMDIIEKEDERTFEEKKKEAINFLKDKENTLLAERLIDIATYDEISD